MAKTRTTPKAPSSPTLVHDELLAFIVEQHPLAVDAVHAALTRLTSDASADDVVKAVRDQFAFKLSIAIETSPFVDAATRYTQEVEALTSSIRDFFARQAIKASITKSEKREMLETMILTRAVDNRMKQLFLSSEMKYGDLGFQGKGFRSLGQEAIVGAALRLRRGKQFVGAEYTGDVVAPLIRDLGVTLMFSDDIARALNAQVGKSGAPSDGKDLHLGDPDRGVLMVAAPLSIATCTITGIGLAFKQKQQDNVAVSFIGEGGSSLGEWHEAINMAAAMELPVIFCVENNQTALSTPVSQQSKVRTFADKAIGYGIPRVTVDGTDCEAIASAFAYAAERARKGKGPTLIETIAMRMCGHAHHDDMLYLGADPPLSFEIPETPKTGYVDKAKYAQWRERDPLLRYAKKLIDEAVVTHDDVEKMKTDALARVEDAVAVLKAREWPDADVARRGVYSDGSTVTPISTAALVPRKEVDATLAVVEEAPAFDPKGSTYLDAIARGLDDVLSQVPEAFLLGEDVGPPYGNAFLLLKPLVDKFGARMLNTPIAEGAIIGACVGAALKGLRPVGEIQFNDFVASGFNQLVNNAAKLKFRAGTSVPMTLRMPYGGLRRAGPYHSQDTSPWFYRTPGLKIVAPSTPHDARALLMSCVLDNDPVLFYEHIGLYRDPKIKQRLGDEVPTPIPLGKAAFRRLGSDLSIIAYGAYVHKAMRVAATLADEGIACDVLDLRSLVPLDFERIMLTVKRCNKVILVGEDAKTGSILESIAQQIQESCYLDLDGPVRVLGSLETPVPYAPSLEDAYLLSEGQIVEACRNLAAW